MYCIILCNLCVYISNPRLLFIYIYIYIYIQCLINPVIGYWCIDLKWCFWSSCQPLSNLGPLLYSLYETFQQTETFQEFGTSLADVVGHIEYCKIGPSHLKKAIDLSIQFNNKKPAPHYNINRSLCAIHIQQGPHCLIKGACSHLIVIFYLHAIERIFFLI